MSLAPLFSLVCLTPRPLDDPQSCSNAMSGWADVLKWQRRREGDNTKDECQEC